ncbi:pyridoxamine 5'-phosphate oxidase family protein [Kitasatospora sp. MAP5-34]|uniref:pyridoxamine 5'-phosphate oxidase family protein n=1 Tax=Kitasatospora sp. MAP5-34 TaxID=3035102 RepID=UPI0024759657|nr:pyridoxamine 5'-phosphate oxidase family protein [Kitasatospora sp. MAP5-34]MDH6577479.1 putative pyridoxine 5'-phosphate oxidase superfamily flavin-nucleotide-binding protein [Kitasatospora sp. MAP5-34]
MVRTANHPGERAVQQRAGEGRAGWGSPMFSAEIPPGFDQFMQRQRMLVIGAVDDDGAAWSTVVTGPRGFVQTLNETTMSINAVPVPGDPLDGVFDRVRDIGILVIEPQSSRRVRINGVAKRDGDRLVVVTEQVLGNCPKYLQQRALRPDDTELTAPVAHHSTELDEAQQRWITEADTFFIASRAPEQGADASHRGGEPGFVQVVSPNRLAWPDYFGNSFYMTLGNLQLDPACGLTFLDWERGHALHVTGKARIDWDQDRAKVVPGALRMVEFDVERIIQVDNFTPLRWRFHAPSPFNPTN